MRFFHPAIDLAAALSLLLCLGFCALQVRSKYVCDVLYRIDSNGAQTCLCSGAGTLQFIRDGATSRGLWIRAGGTSAGQPWQWLKNAPAQASACLLAPGAGDAALDARVILVLAHAVPVYAPGLYSGMRPPAPIMTAASLSVAARDWFVAAVMGILPILRGARWNAARRRARRANILLCAKCGYDLRATPDRCPECGSQNTRRRSADPSTTVA